MKDEDEEIELPSFLITRSESYPRSLLFLSLSVCCLSLSVLFFSFFHHLHQLTRVTQTHLLLRLLLVSLQFTSLSPSRCSFTSFPSSISLHSQSVFFPPLPSSQLLLFASCLSSLALTSLGASFFPSFFLLSCVPTRKKKRMKKKTRKKRSLLLRAYRLSTQPPRKFILFLPQEFFFFLC